MDAHGSLEHNIPRPSGGLSADGSWDQQHRSPGSLQLLQCFSCSGSALLTPDVYFLPVCSVLRFPGSCVAILLYFVVAVTAAPDCHIGTRIFLCGFMIGPMWLSLLLGGVIATLGKLAPTQEGQLIILCVLGPLALVPFAANRVGTSHLYMFAMGLVSCLYLGMPILAGWSAPDITTLWTRAVGFVLVAALIGMFAGSVLSMIVLPSLASHKVGLVWCRGLIVCAHVLPSQPREHTSCSPQHSSCTLRLRQSRGTCCMRCLRIGSTTDLLLEAFVKLCPHASSGTNQTLLCPAPRNPPAARR